MAAGTRSLPLVKAHALGNDFLLATGTSLAAVTDLAVFARRVCDRHRGVGADGLMILDETPGGARTRLFNADGGEAELSGNGLRTAAAWIARTRSLGQGAILVLDTVVGPRRFELLDSSGLRYTLKADMGNPQCVVLGPASEERLHTIARALASHPRFPAGTNVELADVETPHRVRILIWERGVGPTEASGTGACAAAVAAAFAGGAARSVDIASPGGTQHVDWTNDGVWLTGWAELVANVEWHLA
jgi:diaminopimelate epimerase